MSRTGTITPSSAPPNPGRSSFSTNVAFQGAPGGIAPSTSHLGSSSTYRGAERASEYVESAPNQASHYWYRSDRGGVPHPSLHNPILAKPRSAAMQSTAPRQFDPTMGPQSSSAAQNIRAALPSESSFQEAHMRDVPSKSLPGGSLAAGTSTTPHSTSTSTYRGMERVSHRPEDIPSHASHMYRPDQGEASRARQGNTWSMATPPEVPGRLGPAIELHSSPPAEIHRQRSGTITASSAPPNLPPGSSSANMAFQPAQMGSVPGWKSDILVAGAPPSHHSRPSSSTQGAERSVGHEEDIPRVELLREGYKKKGLERERTPETKETKKQEVYQTTPNSNHSNSYAPALPPGEKYAVKKANKYLKVDLKHTRMLPVEEFAKCALNLDVNEDNFQITGPVEAAFTEYLDVVKSAKNEKDKRVYPALVNLLNTLPNDKVKFYCQDHHEVRGSLVGQIPDVGGIYKELAADQDVRFIPHTDGQAVLWSHMVMIVENKIEKGRMVIPEFDIEAKMAAQEAKVGDKRPLGKETGPEGPPTKTSRKGLDIPEIKTSSSSYEYPMGLGPEGIEEAPDRKTPGGTRTQCMGYSRDVMCWGVFRSHVYLILIDSEFLRIILYDHSAIVESGLLDLKQAGDRLNFAKMVKRLRSMSSEEHGFVRGLHADSILKNPKSLIEKENPHTKKGELPSSRIYELQDGSHFTFPYEYTPGQQGQTRTVYLKRVIFRSNGVIGRGTTVAEVECACDCNPFCRVGCDWKGKKLILKLSFPSITRDSEESYLNRCKELATGDHAWVLNHLPKIYCAFDIPFPHDSPQQKLSDRFGNSYQMRVTRGTIQEELKPLSSLATAKECAQVFYDVVQCEFLSILSNVQY
ncbi:hypothetical protein F5880DRAFT_1521559 [Lentinula raphanica]|nr:hypothetical protein F5880DRAFT_1521559 [Lentinula raphanica]